MLKRFGKEGALLCHRTTWLKPGVNETLLWDPATRLKPGVNETPFWDPANRLNRVLMSFRPPSRVVCESHQLGRVSGENQKTRLSCWRDAALGVGHPVQTECEGGTEIKTAGNQSPVISSASGSLRTG